MLDTPTKLTLHDSLHTLLESRNFSELRRLLLSLPPPDVAELFTDLNPEAEAVVFRLLPRELATQTFEYLPYESQEALLRGLGDTDMAGVLNDMSPDDRTALLEELPSTVTRRLLNLLSPQERGVATKLLGYPEESVGRLMTPDYVRVKPDWTVAQILEHVRAFGRDSETLNTLYVVADGGRLVDDIRMREVLLSSPHKFVSELMDHSFVALRVNDDQETAVAEFRRHGRAALPVIDTQGDLVGIVTIDDVLNVAEEEATEDIQRLGGSEALGEPYLTISVLKMVRKRAGWLTLLFFGQMLTATVTGAFEDQLAQALVLVLFIPLIISSGGNSGSQAATLVIRAMTLGEVRLRDWWRVMRREIVSGLVIGGFLGGLGFLRIAAGEWLNGTYGPYWPLVGLTIGLSLMGVVLWGSLSGSLLPFLLKRLGVDPATSSAPFVATLVDVTGLIIYFGVAAILLKGTLL